MSSRRADKTATRRDLSRCGHCHGDLVQPVDWTEGPMNTWEVELRCPECEARERSVFSQREIDDFDRSLDDGMRGLIDDLRRLTRENMEVEADDLASALQQDLILPEDF